MSNKKKARPPARKNTPHAAQKPQPDDTTVCGDLPPGKTNNQSSADSETPKKTKGTLTPRDPLQGITAEGLLHEPVMMIRWVVEGLLAFGLSLLVGAPKEGKSWMALDLALSVSKGEPFLGHPTTQMGVLYLSLEDSYSRLQRRLFMLADEANDLLHLVIRAHTLQQGLIEQIKSYLNANPGIELVIIDTLLAVRTFGPGSQYASDHHDMQRLKDLADECGIAILIIHHTRKQRDPDDVFNNIAGTNSILASADQAMVLSRREHMDSRATLSVKGRDGEPAELELIFRQCRWELVREMGPEEYERGKVPDAVLQVLRFMESRASDWEGTATQLLAETGIENTKGNILAKRLNEHSFFLSERGVTYSTRRTSSARTICLSWADPE